MKLAAYTNVFSVRAGGEIELKVSSSYAEDFDLDLVRIYSADPNPDGPGMDMRPVAMPFEGKYASVSKASSTGSYGILPVGDFTDEPWTFCLRFEPRLVKSGRQTLVDFSSGGGKEIAIQLFPDWLELRVGDEVSRFALSWTAGIWYELRVAATATDVAVRCYRLPGGEMVADGSASLRAASFSEIILAARRSGPVMSDFFNGRLESPKILKGTVLPDPLQAGVIGQEDVLAHWDFSLGIPEDRLHDIGPFRLDGRVFNLPARGVRGSNWSGQEMSWRHAPQEYGAIHFHEGDLYDCGWESDLVAQIPSDLPSGVYGFRVRCGGSEDIVPFFVRPAEGAKTARVAVLFSTLTYLAYCNYPRTNYNEDYRARCEAWNSYPHHPALYPEFGRSLYDVHADGSGVMYSSMYRPQLLMRPGFFAYVDKRGSGLRHFPADMHLIAWLNAMHIEADVVTDHDLDAEGREALAGYSAVLTVTHPEYHTERTLDAIQSYIDEGGNFAYLGGNGFYWRVATSEAFPGAIEIRRGESGVRMWESEPGEADHALDGMRGGLWLRNGRPPQKLVGVGMSAQGEFNGTHYRRTEASRLPELSWLFSGIDEDVLGDFGYSGGGAAGFELDVVDPGLGTPSETLVLAVSEGHGDDYSCVPEKAWNPDDHTPAWKASQIRADLALTVHPRGNAVLAVSSIMFCGSLPWNGYRNSISRLLENFVRKSIS